MKLLKIIGLSTGLLLVGCAETRHVTIPGTCEFEVKVMLVRDYKLVNEMCRKDGDLRTDAGLPVPKESTVLGCASTDNIIISLDRPDVILHEMAHIRSYNCK